MSEIVSRIYIESMTVSNNEEDEDIVFAGRALRGVLFLGGDLVLQFP